MVRRRNPEDSPAMAEGVKRATAVTEEFHGRPIEWRKDLHDQHVYQLALAVLGDLYELWIGNGNGKAWPIRFSSQRPYLATSVDQRSLYVVGGVQDVSMETFGLPAAAQKDQIALGHLVRISYKTGKDFHDFDPLIYVHDFGSLEDGNEELLEPWQKAMFVNGRGPVPMLNYNTLNQRFLIVGGAYYVRREGIVG